MSENEPVSAEQKVDATNNKDIAAFAYTLIFAPILLITRRESPFIVFHARQAFVLFIFAVIFWSLGGSLRFFNIFVLVGCAVGFLHAMGEEWYQMPFVYELSKGGLTPSSIWGHVQLIFQFLKRIFAGILPKKIVEKWDINTYPLAENGISESRIAELERLFCIEKYFRQSHYHTCPPDFQAVIEKTLQKFRDYDEKMIDRRENDIIFVSGNFGKVVLGGFTGTSFYIGFSQKAFPHRHPKFHLGDFGIEEVKTQNGESYSFF